MGRQRNRRWRVVRGAFLIVAAMVVLVFGQGASAPVAALEPKIRWYPEQPIQGTLFVVEVDPGGVEWHSITGEAAGERLHFVRRDDATAWALAAAPLDRGHSLSVQVVVTAADGRDVTARVEVAVHAGEYAMEQVEQLTVAGQFVAPPDEATAARQRREQEKAAAVSRLAHETPRLWDEVVLPRVSRVTSGFGTGREFNGQVQSRHTGVDYAGAVGAPVYAAAAGIVALVDSFHLAGNVIYINHGAGLVTGYFHLSEALVAEGDRVAPGDLIGRVGATGRVTGPHLHWLVRYGHISVDGRSLVELAAKLR